MSNLAYAIFLYQGVGNLFPWNAFINAGSYFEQRFCSTSLKGSFQNYFSLTFSVSQTFGLALAVKYQNKLSLWSKVSLPLLLYSIIFSLTSIFVTIDMDPILLFWLTLGSTILCGIFGSLLSGGLFGLAAVFPPIYTGALMNGQGLAGLVVSISDILTLLSESPTNFCDSTSSTNSSATSTCGDFYVETSALAYFLIATIILASCIVAFFVLQNLSITHQFLEEAGNMNQLPNAANHNQKESFILSQPLMSANKENSSFSNESESKAITGIVIIDRQKSVNRITNSNDKRKSTTQSPLHNKNEGIDILKLDEDDMMDISVTPFSKIYDVFNIVRIPSVSVFLVFFVTIGIFPSIIQHVSSVNSCDSNQRFYNDLFVPFLFLLFNLFDFIGRILAGLTKTPFLNAQNIWMASTCRLIFFPLFLLCNIKDSQLPVVFSYDFFPIVFMILFAISNGYVSTTCMMIGPSIVDIKQAQLAGSIMIFSLTFGLLGGACVSFLIILISQGYV